MDEGAHFHLVRQLLELLAHVIFLYRQCWRALEINAAEHRRPQIQAMCAASAQSPALRATSVPENREGVATALPRLQSPPQHPTTFPKYIETASVTTVPVHKVKVKPHYREKRVPGKSLEAQHPPDDVIDIDRLRNPTLLTLTQDGGGRRDKAESARR